MRRKSNLIVQYFLTPLTEAVLPYWCTVNSKVLSHRSFSSCTCQSEDSKSQAGKKWTMQNCIKLWHNLKSRLSAVVSWKDKWIRTTISPFAANVLLFLLADSFTKAIIHFCWGFFFLPPSTSSIFSVWILFHNQHNVLLFVCVYITDLHSNHIFSPFPSMLKCRCSRSSWEKVVRAKYTVGINKHFIRPWKRVKPMYGGGAGLQKGGKKTPLSSFEWAVWEVIINR